MINGRWTAAHPLVTLRVISAHMCWVEGVTVLGLEHETFAGTFPFAPHYHRIGDFAMHYVDEGSGEPVVMLHGDPTWGYLFRNFIPPRRLDGGVPRGACIARQRALQGLFNVAIRGIPNPQPPSLGGKEEPTSA